MMNAEVQSYVLEFNEKGMKTVKGRIRDFKTTADEATSSASKLGKILGLITSYMSVSKIIEYTNSWQQLTNQLKVVTVHEKAMMNVRQDLIEMSREARADILATSKLYQRLAIQADNLGTSHKDMMEFVEASTKAMAITGPTAQEARSVLLQLGQAMGTAAVNGDEFRTIAEGAPRLLKAVADSLGVTSGEVKRLTRDGKLLSKEFFNALVQQLPVLRAEFNQTDITLSQSGIIFTNSLKVAIGRLGELTGSANALSKLIVTIADKIATWADNAMAAAVVFVDIGKELAAFSLNEVNGDPEGFAKAVTRATQGWSDVFLKTMELGGKLFVTLIQTGFQALAPLFSYLGELIAQSFATIFYQHLPKGMQSGAAGATLEQIQPSTKGGLLNQEAYDQLLKKLSDQAILDIKGATALPGKSKELADLFRQSLTVDDFKQAMDDNVTGRMFGGAKGRELDPNTLAEIASFRASVVDLSAIQNNMDDSFKNVSTSMKKELTDFIAENDLSIKSLDDWLDRYMKARNELKRGPEDFIPMLKSMDDLKISITSVDGVGWWADFKLAGLQAIEEIKLAWGDFTLAFEDTASVDSMLNGIGQGIAEVNKEVMNTTKVFSDFTQKAIKGFSDELTEALTGGAYDFKAFARAAINSLISVMIQALITQMIMSAIAGFGGGGPVATGVGAVVGGATGGVSGVPAGTAQFGATVDSQQPTIIGERRPEMFIPNTSGRVANFEQGTKDTQPSIRIVNVGENALDEVSSAAGERIIMNILKKNKTSLRGILT